MNIVFVSIVEVVIFFISRTAALSKTRCHFTRQVRYSNVGGYTFISILLHDHMSSNRKDNTSIMTSDQVGGFCFFCC